MNKKLVKLTYLSIKRRWRQIIRACIATFLAVFFITSVLIFEENMFEWQVASNKDRFGNWFVMETNREKQSEQIVGNSKISSSGTAHCAVKMYDEEFAYTGNYIGYLTPEFIEIGYIEPAEGRMPEADNEVAMDWNTLMSFGITNPEVGQTISVSYYEKNAREEENKRTEEFILTGILEDYTNIWKKGSELPGAIVTKERYDVFGYRTSSVHIYELALSERNKDYQVIYQELIDGTKLKPTYNSYVYDYKAWGSQTVYNYMYILVMVIGIAALTYQLIVYKNSRKNTYRMMRNLGATKLQIAIITFFENAIILLPSGALGIIGAAFVGKLICMIIENQMGIAFYYLDIEIFAKGLLSILIAVVVEELASRLLTLKQVLVPKKSAKVKVYGNAAKVNKNSKFKVTLNSGNVLRKISFRFTKSNKLAQNFGLRLFSLAICVVIVLCGLRIYDTYTIYNQNKDNIDLIGTAYQDKEFAVNLPFYIKGDNINYMNYDDTFKAILAGEVNIADIQITPTEEQIDRVVNEGNVMMDFDDGSYANLLDQYTEQSIGQLTMRIKDCRYYRQPDVNFTKGFSAVKLDTIKNMTGVKEISYSTYESQRAWTWEGMSLDKMGYSKLLQKKNANMANIEPYASRYLFATEYVSPTEKLYSRISKYMEPEMVDYEAFCNGEQVLVLVADTPYGEYDDTLKAGTTINYHYYDMPFSRYNLNEDRETQNIFSYDEPYLEFTEHILYEIREKENGSLYIGLLEGKEARNSYMACTKENAVIMKPCVQAKAAGVVYLTDEIQEEFSDLISTYGYYTAIASNTLAENAAESQNKLMAEMAGVSVEELPDDCKVKVVYNKMYVKYDLMASICATDNILSTFCKENDINCVSFAEVNEQYRTNFINAILQYGITIAAAIVINMLISAIIAQNRLEARKERISLLLRIGTEKGRVCRVFMIEALRESLWCVFTMPLILIIQYVIYSRNIKSGVQSV